MAGYTTKIMQNNALFNSPDDFGLRSPVIQKIFQTKSDTSMVASVSTKVALPPPLKATQGEQKTPIPSRRKSCEYSRNFSSSGERCYLLLLIERPKPCAYHVFTVFFVVDPFVLPSGQFV